MPRLCRSAIIVLAVVALTVVAPAREGRQDITELEKGKTTAAAPAKVAEKTPTKLAAEAAAAKAAAASAASTKADAASANADAKAEAAKAAAEDAEARGAEGAVAARAAANRAAAEADAAEEAALKMGSAASAAEAVAKAAAAKVAVEEAEAKGAEGAAAARAARAKAKAAAEDAELMVQMDELTWDKISGFYKDRNRTKLQKEEEWKKHKGKKVDWRGTVADVEETGDTLLVHIRMNADTIAADVTVSLYASFRADALKLKKRDRVWISGSLDEWGGAFLPFRLVKGQVYKDPFSRWKSQRQSQ